MAGPEALSSRDAQSLGKVPPHSLEAEEALLGSALLSRDAVSRLMEEVKPSDFYSPSNQTVYESMKGLFDTGKPIDTVTVSERAQKKGPGEISPYGEISNFDHCFERFL